MVYPRSNGEPALHVCKGCFLFFFFPVSGEQAFSQRGSASPNLQKDATIVNSCARRHMQSRAIERKSKDAGLEYSSVYVLLDDLVASPRFPARSGHRGSAASAQECHDAYLVIWHKA